MNETYVNTVSSASKTGSHPNLGGPRVGTIFPSVQPLNKTGSVPGPVLYTKVQRAHAPHVGKLSSIRSRPFTPTEEKHIRTCNVRNVSRARRTFVPEFTQEKLDVGAQEAVHCRKAQGGIFGDHWAANLSARTQDNPSCKSVRGADNFCCTTAFFDGYLLCRVS